MESRAPQRTRESTSRPSSSVPNQYPCPGCSDGGAFWASGSCGAIAGARTAIAIQVAASRMPTTASGWRQAAETRRRRRKRGREAAPMLIGHPPMDYERVEGAWGNREVAPHREEEGGNVGETWFPPRERAEGERRSSTHLLRAPPIPAAPQRVVVLRLERLTREVDVRRVVERRDAELVLDGEVLAPRREVCDAPVVGVDQELRARGVCDRSPVAHLRNDGRARARVVDAEHFVEPDHVGHVDEARMGRVRDHERVR